MKSEAVEYFEVLWKIANDTESSLKTKYKQLRSLLELICRVEMTSVDLQTTDLSARISFVGDKFDLSYAEEQRLHSFRLTSNKLMNEEDAVPERLVFLRDLKTISFFIRKIYKVQIPNELYRILPENDLNYSYTEFGNQKYQKLRVCFKYKDDNYLYVQPTNHITSELVKVRYNIEEVNSEFKGIGDILWPHAQLNLLDVSVDDEGVFTPQMFVLEPDYLIDISALAECFKAYGAHPLNYILSRLQSIKNAEPLLLGNIVNHFLDEWIHLGNEITYTESMKRVFKDYALKLASCPELIDRKTELEFFEKCKMHFDHIGYIINQTFDAEGYKLDLEDAVLEPSYICEALGLQGRLDYMQRDLTSLIEMKSGKADEWTLKPKVVPYLNHRVQMLLYQAVLHYNMNRDRKDIRPYLLYTRYPLLYPARTSWSQVKKAISLRNQIVANEYKVQASNSIEETVKFLMQISSNNLNVADLADKFWNKFLAPPIDEFHHDLLSLKPDERAYYVATYNFITKELYTSKSGDMDYDGNKGASAVWNACFEEKCEEGSILFNLKIKANNAAEIHKPHLVFKRCGISSLEAGLPNFRNGDAVVVYERNLPTDNVTNKLIFKGNIESLQEDSVCVRLRAAQQNLDVLPMNSTYAIEPDSTDTVFRNMYLGLEAFVKANAERRDLLLGKRKPKFDRAYNTQIAKAETDLERVVAKALATKDYFLLVGPPGTGKTSFALRGMVEAFREEQKSILLLAYTNQAVNEICGALDRIGPTLNYIRIGNELSCDKRYRGHLLEQVLEGCKNRASVRRVIDQCNIYVSTVASLSGKPEIFLLKHFDVAIVDEASQILEPHLLGLLCAKNSDGKNGIGKFILIGDHKQLPAVVQQKPESSRIENKHLNDLKIWDMRDALFQRLYHLGYEESIDWLTCQGRMHPEIAEFVNLHFYEGKLSCFDLPHQRKESLLPIDRLCLYPSDKQSVNIFKRVNFIEAKIEQNTDTYKVNHTEAEISAHIAFQIKQQLGDEFNPDKSLGIITPYRSQIALIKSYLEKYDQSLSSILVDTVERFQGSERDIIIYSFCVNTPFQLDFLSNVIKEGNYLIDRKLNVALTRARKQLFLTGVSSLLKLNPIYKELLNYIENLN